MPGRMMVIAAYDSQVKWAMGLAREFAAQGWSHTVAVPSDIRHSLSPAQVAAAGVVELVQLPWAELLTRASGMDCVVLAVQGPLVERFTDELTIHLRQTSAGHRPVVVTGWVGIVIEKLVAGYLDRAGSDVVAVNSADNLRKFISVGAKLGLPSDNLLLSGLPLLPNRPAPRRSGPVRTVLFADQPTIPGSRWDRAFIYQRLIDYAVAHPDRRVLLKPRHRPDEDTFHVMKHHPEAVLAGLPAPSANFSVTYQPITELLDTIDLMMTVSSTAALEAIGAGVPTAFVSDLGIHERLGNHVLIPSGLLATFDRLISDDLPVPDPEWLADIFADGDDLTPAQRIVRRVEQVRTLPLVERPGALVTAAPYLSGRIAVRQRRTGMPAAARPPAISPHRTRLAGQFRTRGELILRGLLPRRGYEIVAGWLRDR